ncbi:MAG: zinc-binding metallopeptidase family protein [Solirubrobacteraceae bacterium]
MLNGRLYRAAFLPFLIALAVAAFSLTGRPQPLGSTLAPDAFEGAPAMADLHELAARYPQRRPGSPADDRLAADIAGRIRALGGTAGGGFSVHLLHLEGATIDGTRGLTTVLAVRPGSTAEAPLLILAHRDAAAAPSEAELSGTAALLELARVFASRETKRTIVLVSTSGGSGGDGGAAALPEALSSIGLREPYEAAVVLGDVAAARTRHPFVLPYSDGFGSAPLQLALTMQDAIRREYGGDPGAPSTLGQLAHLMFPLAVGEQGVLDAQGLPAVEVQASAERGPARNSPVSEATLEGLGRGVLSALDALDGAPDISAQLEAGLQLQKKSMPEWALRLLLGALLLPPLLAALDGLARARRRRLPVGRSTLWTLSCALPFLCCTLLCLLLGELGIISSSPSVPTLPAAIGFGARAASAVAAVALTFVLVWLLRAVLLRRLRAAGATAGAEAAGLPIVLLIAALGAVVWVGNPYTALLLIPAVHLWLLLAAPELRPGRIAGLALVLLGLAPLALLIGFYAHQLGMGPEDVAWGAVLMVAGGHVGFGSALLWSAGLGCAAAAAMLALERAPEPLAPAAGEPPEITIRGPRSYAGPGSLGGTESALRR